ncbi:MAG TPA: hypothetical protein VJJ23_04105 [Candidatus Nanoarchaeia archaeon]|nr:hypothetical protein [Candidatus Nanoarchaeia archaeon]
MVNLRDLFEKETYLSINSVGTEFDKIYKKRLNIKQNLSMTYSLDDVIAIDKKIQPKIFSRIFGANSEYFDLSYKISKLEDFYKLLDEIVWEHYDWNHMGLISRLEKPELDKDSLRIRLHDNVKINSTKDGNFKLKIFSVNFKAKVVVEYGGLVGIDTPQDRYKNLIDWAQKHSNIGLL